MSSLPLPTMPETAKEKDLRLFQDWKKTPPGFLKQQKLSELLSVLGGPIGTAVNSFRGAPLPQVTLELEGKSQACDALNEFDPAQSGMSLANFVTTRVKQRLSRYVITHQNVARIPEHQVRQIGPLREAMADLTSRFGREPTTDELADHLGLPIKHVTRLRKNLRADLLEETGGLNNIEAFEHDPNFEAAMLVYFQLTTQEKSVFDYLLGAHGQPKLSPGQIAERLKISNGRVSQLKEAIAVKIQPYMEK